MKASLCALTLPAVLFTTALVCVSSTYAQDVSHEPPVDRAILSAPEVPETPAPEAALAPRMEVTPTQVPTPVRPAPDKTRAVPGLRAWRVGVGVYYSAVNQFDFPSAQFNNLGYVAKFGLDTAWGFQGEISYFREHSWGFQLGAMIDNQRSIRQVDKNGTVNGTTYFTGSSLDLRSFYLNALYRWGHFYLPFGASYTGGIVGQPPVLLSSLAAGFGAQAGVGWELNRHFTFEILYRLMTLRGLETDDGTSSNEGGLGYLWGPQAGIKVLF